MRIVSMKQLKESGELCLLTMERVARPLVLWGNHLRELNDHSAKWGVQISDPQFWKPNLTGENNISIYQDNPAAATGVVYRLL